MQNMFGKSKHSVILKPGYHLMNYHGKTMKILKNDNINMIEKL